MSGEPKPKRVIPVTIVIEDGCFQDLLYDDEDIEFSITVEDRDSEAIGQEEGEEGEEEDGED